MQGTVYRGTDQRLAERAFAIWRNANPRYLDPMPTVYGRKTIYTVKADTEQNLPGGEYGFLTPEED